MIDDDFLSQFPSMHQLGGHTFTREESAERYKNQTKLSAEEMWQEHLDQKRFKEEYTRPPQCIVKQIQYIPVYRIKWAKPKPIQLHYSDNSIGLEPKYDIEIFEGTEAEIREKYPSISNEEFKWCPVIGHKIILED